MELKRRKAAKYGLALGVAIAALCSLPLAISFLSLAFIHPDISDSTYMMISGLTMLLGNLMLTCAPLSLPVAAATGYAALHSARAAITSLNDAVTINFVASLLMALTGAFGAALVIVVSAGLFSGEIGGSLLIYALPGALAFAIVLFTISFFCGLIYSVYSLKLKYVRQSPGQ